MVYQSYDKKDTIDIVTKVLTSNRGSSVNPFRPGQIKTELIADVIKLAVQNSFRKIYPDSQ